VLGKRIDKNKNMNREYFIMAVDESKGFATGFYDAVLTRKDPKLVDGRPIQLGEYGYHQWYAGPEKYATNIDPLPDDIVLVEREEYKYNVRQGSAHFFVISELFLKTIKGLNHHFKEIKSVTTYNKQGKIIKDRNLHIAVPLVVKKQDCLVLEQTSSAKDKGILTEKVRFKNDWNSDLFSVVYISPRQDTLMCSQKAKNALETANVQGIRYVPAEQVMSKVWIEENNEGMYLPRKYEPV